MATLFFEGFDKGIVFNQLDPNYWTTQFKQYPKYSFGGYLSTYFESSDNSYIATNQYTYNSPNGGILPEKSYIVNQATSPSDGILLYRSNNAYPAFGSPPGFLAFTNIEVENSNEVEYPTYLQASGFSLPSGNISYLSMRCLGLESKHSDYSEYPYRHTLFSYNSGDIPQLTVNVVKITGTNNFVPINAQYETLALEIQQNNNTIGYFDLNITNNITGYRIASIYSSNNNILTPAHSLSYSQKFASLLSRWVHLEFSIDESEDEPTLFINAEDINLPVVNFNNDILKEDWDLGLPISGFKFDNLRFYNRTYSSSIINNSFGATNYVNSEDGKAYYYMFGKNWLLDDLVLIDNTGLEPSYWLGSTTRVMQLVPGSAPTNPSDPPYFRANILKDNYGRTDGIKDWTTNSVARIGSYYGSPIYEPSHRRALSFLDNDIHSIEAINSGAIDAVAFAQRGVGSQYGLYDNNSLWRETLNEAIGGIKLYNNARKKYLDTKFVNVFRSGVGDPLEDSVSLLLHGDVSPIIDSTKIPKSVGNTNVIIKGDNTKFGQGSLYFNDSNSYLSVIHSDLGNNAFTIECWLYFQNHDQIVSLFDRKGISENNCNTTYGFYASTTGVLFYRKSNCDKLLLFNSGAPTGVWNHIAVVRTSDDKLRCFLNGVANTGYNIRDCYSRQCNGETVSPIENQGTVNGTYSLNFLDDKNLLSIDYYVYQGINYVGVAPPLKIGQPKRLSTTDEYFNNVSLLVKSDRSSIIDLSSNIKTPINNNTVFSYDRSRFGDKSLYFTGGKTLAFSNSNDFNFGSGDFTIDFWFYIKNSGSVSYKILNSNNLNIRILNGGNSIDVYLTNSNGISYKLHTSQGYYSMGISQSVWYYVSLVKYLGDLFAYIVPINSTITPYYAWPLHILKNQSVLNLEENAYNIYNNFAIDLNNFTLGDSNSSLTHDLYIDNFRITKGIARTTTRLLGAVTSPKDPFGNSLPDENSVDYGVYIDDYRVTYGVNRYSSNFIPPNQPFKTERDDYYPLGPEYSVSKTTYKTFQHYALINPATQQNWTLPQVSGLILGVKKL